MLARAEVRCYILTLVQYYANTADSYIHSVKTEPYVKEILNNLQYYPPETHPLSPAKLVLTILTKPLPCRVEVFGLGHIEQPNYCALGSNNVLY